jgi:predicted DNA-binding ArsR family transcriptional regulator
MNGGLTWWRLEQISGNELFRALSLLGVYFSVESKWRKGGNRIRGWRSPVS